MFDKVIETSIEKLERMECSKKCQARSIRTCGRVPQGIKSQLKSPPKNTFFSNRLLVSSVSKKYSSYSSYSRVVLSRVE
jgi:hypothetical protein